LSVSLLVDGREFVAGRRTGIGRFMEGLLLALHSAHPDWLLTVAMRKDCALPSSLLDKVQELYVPHAVECFWPGLARGYQLFLSPYPKLPWRKMPCPAIHTVHDILYLTHPAYKGNRLRVWAGKLRLRHALKRALLTWFDSAASLDACRLLFGHVSHAAVHHLAVDEMFRPQMSHGPDHPYFLFVGNGLPHKNLSVLLEAMEDVDARLVCVGVRHQEPLLAQYNHAVKQKIEFPQSVDDEALLAWYRGAVALLLPSTAEGYGYPPLEAMACGTPAIISDIAVLSETTGGAAMTCPADDADAWRRGMQSMLDENTRKAWSDKGLEWVAHLRAPEGWQRHIEDIESLLGPALPFTHKPRHRALARGSGQGAVRS